MLSRDYNRVRFRRVEARQDNGFVAASALQSEGAGNINICAYDV
jgi:hypothetical protein